MCYCYYISWNVFIKYWSYLTLTSIFLFLRKTGMSPEYFALALTLFRKGGGRTKSLPPPLYYFFSVTSPNVGISPHIFLTFSFNLFTTLLLNFKTISSISNKLLNFNQDHSSKNQFFWSNPYKIEVMITSINIEMLELPNFG